MKKRILAVVIAAALGLSGCAQSEGGKIVNVVDVGSSSSSSSTSSLSSTAATSSATASSSSSSTAATSSATASSSSSSTSATSSATASSSSSSTAATSSTTVSSSSSSSTSSSSSLIQTSTSSTSSSSSIVENPSDTPSNNYQAVNYDEIKGVWISYLELSSLASSTESTFRESISEIFNNCADFGFNTVYIHARSHGDAYYSSSLFPRTKYLGGSYDPLKIAVEEAHKRNLSIHAWINPLRACSSADASRESGYKIGDWISGGTRAVLVSGYYYLNPAYDEVIKLISDGVTEIVTNYNVDGIHIDDYFYPTTAASFDSEAFDESGYSSLSDFRFANCDRFVSSIYKAVKSANKSLLFSLSCQGNIDNDYLIYADVKKWCSEQGYLDVIIPQIYFGFDNQSRPFEKCCTEWDSIARAGNKALVIGIAAYKIGTEDAYAGTGKNEWINDSAILARQFISARELENYAGCCVYSYNSLFKPSSSVKDKVESEREALKNALIKNGDL